MKEYMKKSAVSYASEQPFQTGSWNKFSFNETHGVSKNYSYQYAATVKSYKGGQLMDMVTFDSKIVPY